MKKTDEEALIKSLLEEDEIINQTQNEKIEQELASLKKTVDQFTAEITEQIRKGEITGGQAETLLQDVMEREYKTLMVERKLDGKS